MPTVKVRNLKNKEVGEVSLADAVFGVELNESLIHAALMNYQANGRQGTSATKTRGNVSGSGRKLWKQKGTGRARIASLRSPLWKGGGNVHGPQPRDWSYQMPKKMRRGALRSALSERLREGNLIVIDGFEFKNPKTSEFLGAMGTLGLSDKKTRTKTLIIDSLDNLNLILSSRNVEKTKVTNSFGLNIYDIIYHEKLLISKAALEELSALLDPKRETGKAEETVEAKPKAKKEAAAPAEAEVVAEVVEELPGPRQRDERGGLQDGQTQGQVAGVLRDLRLAGLALLAELLEAGDHDSEQLQDDRRGDVRHDAEREDRQVQQRPAGEQVQQVEYAAAGAGVVHRFETRLHVGVGHTGARQGGAQPVQRDHRYCEQQFLAQVRRPERTGKGGEQLLPPARGYRRVRRVGERHRSGRPISLAGNGL